MPPKQTTARWPPSRVRTTARKSIPPNTSVKIAPPPPPPIISSPTLNTTTSAHVSPPIKSGIKKTLAADSSLVNCSTNKPVVPKETQNPMETASIGKQPETASIGEQPSEVLIQADNNEGDLAGTGKGTRKVIRRTVRVVKRVIKRRVPKNESLNPDLVEEDNSNNNVCDLVTDSDVIEKPKVRVEEEDKLVVVEGVIEKPNVVAQDELNETSLIRRVETGVSEPVFDDTVNDATDFQDNVASRGEKRTLEEDNVGHESVVDDEKSDVMAVDTSFPDKERVQNPIPVEDVIVKPKLVSASLNIQDEGLKETLDDSIGEAVLEPMVDVDQTLLMNVDKENDKTDKNDVNMSFPNSVEEEKNVVLVEEEKNEDVSLGKQPQSEDNHSVECNEGGLLFSDELEALERKKRRKIEIFVGGLEKDVKEDDIRKAFQEAGTVVGLDLVMNTRKTGKNKGFAFVKFSNAAEANTALTKYSSVKICGKQSHVQPVQGNDTIFLGNIERNWKTEDIMKLLEKAGVDKMIDKVIVKADPRNFEKNRGFAFLEFETNRAAQNAFYKLQNRNIFGKNTKVKVVWADPLVEPAEEEILKVKAVYAEYIPSSWNEENVKEYFKRFGEIDSVAHSKDLTSSRRSDYAFINYKTREAALACIEAIRKEQLLEDDGSKVKMAVSLAKPISARKQLKNDTSTARKQLSKDTSKVSTATVKLHEPRNTVTYAISSYNHGRGNTTDELVHILRRQASTNHIPPRGIPGPFIPENQIPVHSDKRPFPFAGHDPLYMESRGIPRARLEYSNPIPGPSHLLHGYEMEPFPYHQQPGHGLNAESIHGRNVYHRHVPTRGRERSPPPYYVNSNSYRQY